LLPNIGKKQSLSQQAYLVIKEAILNNSIKPGDLLLEEPLAEALGISRTPLRAALKQLQFEKFVYSTPSRQMAVAELNRKDLENLFVLRLAIEPVAARLAAARITDEALERLEKNLKEEQAAIAAVNFIEVIRYEREFNMLLLEAGGNTFFADVASTIDVYTQRFHILSMIFPTSSPLSLGEHQAIVDRIRARDLAGAEEQVRRHLHNVLKRMGACLPI
jgi:DNA-binding GntR family transcriptional regulator